jgi:hypothetical protein
MPGESLLHEIEGRKILMGLGSVLKTRRPVHCEDRESARRRDKDPALTTPKDATRETTARER